MRPFYSPRSLPWLALVALLGACAPAYQLAVVPAQCPNSFVEGRAQARAFTADSVEVRLSFVCFEPTRLVFEAVYRNPWRGQQLVVAPAAFAYQPRREPAAPLPAQALRPQPARGTNVSAQVAAASVRHPLATLPSQPLAAFDPEPEIVQLRATAEREAAKASRVDWLGVALAITSVAVDVASTSKRETPARNQRRIALQEAIVAYQVAAAASRTEHAVTAETLHLRALNLEDFALRKVTLAPGQQVRGLVYFPRFDAADSLRVLAPVPGGALPLDFVQTHTQR